MANRLKVKYLYLKPKTPEAQENQQRIVDKAYDILFESVITRKVKEMGNASLSEGHRKVKRLK
jgi:hypothetical protein